MSSRRRPGPIRRAPAWGRLVVAFPLTSIAGGLDPGLRRDDIRRGRDQGHLAIRAGNRLAMAMTVELPALEQGAAPRRRSFWLRALVRLRRLARPGLGLLLPVGLALGWEIYVALGYSN